MRIMALALNTFREAIRDKILYSLLFFALLMIGSSVLVGRLTLGEYAKIIQDVGLGAINLFGVLIAIFVGIQLVSREVERRTIYTVLSKPIYRAQFVVGKFAGLALTLLVQVAIMTLGFLLLVKFSTGDWPWNLLVAIGLIFLELLVLTAFAVLFSCFTTPTLSGLFTGSVFLIGHLSDDIVHYGRESEAVWVQKLSELCWYVLPNLENFNIKNQAVHQVPLPEGHILSAVVYGVVYLSAVLLLASAVLERRDFR